jgi:hypothetical protein
MTSPGAPAGGAAPQAAVPAAAAGDRSSLTESVTRQCQALGLRHLDITIAPQRRNQAERDIVAIERRQGRIAIAHHERLLEGRTNEMLHRLCAVLAVVGNAATMDLRALADLSDGEDSGRNILSFCSRDPEALLIPDHVFVRTRGYESYRRLARNSRTTWSERSGWLIWRGLSTGAGKISKETLSAQDAELLQRVRLCLALRDLRQADVKLHGIAQSHDHAIDTERLSEAGILGGYVNPLAWFGLKLAIDIDGNTNAWQNLFTRLLMGCCVLKVASIAGYRQWYYGDLTPWLHFVPVQADLSDLKERVAWCCANLDRCAAIAAAGQEFALARDFDSEIAAASRRLAEAQAGKRLRTDEA